MIEKTTFKEIIFWLIFIGVAVLLAFWIIRFAKESFEKNDNLIFTKTIISDDDLNDITIKIPEGEVVKIDVDKNGILFEDGKYRVFPFSANFGGTGNFYYLILLEKQDSKFVHIDSLFIGDRINPVSIEKFNNKIIFDYKSHNMSQAMAEEPTVSTKLEFEIKNGKFIELAKYFNTNSNNVVLVSPKPNEIVNSNFDLSFKAKSWLFENSSLVKLIAEDYTPISESQAVSIDGEWMTADLVSIKSNLNAENFKGKAKIILIADNPSDLRDKDKSVEFWVYIK